MLLHAVLQPQMFLWSPLILTLTLFSIIWKIVFSPVWHNELLSVHFATARLCVASLKTVLSTQCFPVLQPMQCVLMLNKMDRGVSKGLSVAFHYPEFLLPVLCSSLALASHLAWLDGHFARGELEEIVCSPSVCSSFKSLIASQWWDGLTFVFAELLFIFVSSFSAKQKPWMTDVHKLMFKWIQCTACDIEGIQVISNCYRIVHSKWEINFSSSKTLFYGYPLLLCFSASSTHWGEKNASCWTDRAYFECQTYL